MHRKALALIVVCTLFTPGPVPAEVYMEASYDAADGGTTTQRHVDSVYRRIVEVRHFVKNRVGSKDPTTVMSWSALKQSWTTTPKARAEILAVKKELEGTRPESVIDGLMKLQARVQLERVPPDGRHKEMDDLVLHRRVEQAVVAYQVQGQLRDLVADVRGDQLVHGLLYPQHL